MVLAPRLVGQLRVVVEVATARVWMPPLAVLLLRGALDDPLLEGAALGRSRLPMVLGAPVPELG